MDNHSTCRRRSQAPPDQEPEGVEPGAPSIDDSSPPIPRKTAVNNVGSQCTWWCWVLPDLQVRWSPTCKTNCLNAPGGAGCFPTSRRVVRCPAWGNGPRVATGLRAPLGPGRAPLIEPGFAQFSQGPPLTGLQGVRATRMSTRPCGSRGAVPCSSDTGARTRATDWEALARRLPGGGGRRPRAGRPRCSPVQWGDVGPAAGVLVVGDGGGGPLLVALHAGQGGEHGDRVVDEASAGPGH